MIFIHTKNMREQFVKIGKIIVKTNIIGLPLSRLGLKLISS